MANTKLIPNLSVGDIKFGDDIKNYFDLEFDYYPKGEDYIEDLYVFRKPPVSVYVDERKLVTSINCFKECYWKETNLIGLPIKNFIKLIGASPDSSEKIFLIVNKIGQTQTVYEFESFGLQVWTYRNKIVSIFCTTYNDV